MKFRSDFQILIFLSQIFPVKAVNRGLSPVDRRHESFHKNKIFTVCRTVVSILSRLERSPSLTLRVTFGCGDSASFNRTPLINEVF